MVRPRKRTVRPNPEVGPAVSVSRLPDLLRRRARAGPEWALHHHAIDPAAALETDGWEKRRVREAQRLVKADRAMVPAIADHRNHLPIAERRAPLDQGL